MYLSCKFGGRKKHEARENCYLKFNPSAYKHTDKTLDLTLQIKYFGISTLYICMQNPIISKIVHNVLLATKKGDGRIFWGQSITSDCAESAGIRL